MSPRKNLERAFLAFAVLTLAACAETPRTELAWDVREHRTSNSNTFYGPSSVTLPPVQRKSAPKAAPAQTVTSAPLAPVPSQKPRRTPGWYTPAPQPVQVAQHTDDPAPAAAQGAVKFRWPLAGHIVSDFGPNATGERNDGINIAAPQGTEVHAAAAGTVSYCGNELRGYGKLVLIQHDDGYITAYAHVDSILVNRSDKVAAGQVIATAGATGDVASPQLHFEIRHDRRPVDPKALLPKGIVVASN
jgi:murein DD-endopeptidase MepM/ murein hydrolase activator NlpD